MNFFTDRSGNVASMTVIALVPIIGLLGGALDLVRLTTADDELQRALDAATLAAASLTQKNDIDDTIDSYVKKNLGSSDLLDTLTITVVSDLSLNSREVLVEATAKRQTLFLTLLGVDEVDVAARSIAVQSANQIEVSLLLDISGSMGGSKIKELKKEAQLFVDELFDADTDNVLSMSLIPFAESVNLGPLFNTYAVEVGGAGVTENPDAAAYDLAEDLATAKFRFTGIKHGNAYGSPCIEYHDDDFDTLDRLPERARSQLPNWWENTNFRAACPQGDDHLFLNSDDRTALKSAINDYSLYDGTGLNQAILWGGFALSPAWRGHLGGDFSDRPGDFGPEVLKVLVIMTDGEMHVGERPLDPEIMNTHTNKDPSNNRTIGDEKGGGKGNHKNLQRVIKWGNADDDVDLYTAYAQAKRVCNNLKAQGTVIFSIGFKIKKGKNSDKLLAECASSPSHYYLVEDLDIGAAFQSIARIINSLRIVG